MNEDDLIKGGRAAALPNGSEAGLVSHVTSCKRYRFSNFDLQVLGKITKEDMIDMIFGPVPPCDEEADDEDDVFPDDVFSSAVGEDEKKGNMKCTSSQEK